MVSSWQTVLISCAALAASALCGAEPRPPQQPNIIVVMLDDLGFSDFGCYGGEIATPHIDSLAASGLRFTQFYNASRCCPTRAALLTGLYPHQVGLRLNGQSLTRDGITIAEALADAGYQTAMVGKWHLSKTPVLPERHQEWIDHRYEPFNQPFGPLASYPLRRGFHRFYGIIWGVVNFFDPFSLVDGMQPVREVADDYYFTDAISQRAIEYVRGMAAEEAPFFLYVAHAAPHWPLHARRAEIAKYRDTYRGGWHELRARRFARQCELGLFDPDTTPLPPTMGRGADWEALDEAQREVQSAKMAVHAAMVDRVDQGIGQLLEALREVGRLQETLILILADNGASPEIPRQPGYDRTATTREGAPVRYAGFTADEVGDETTYTGIGPYWANAANTPFRYWKAESFEGGNHTPLIAHWPAGLRTAPGAVTDQVGHVIDILPTCLDLADSDYPSHRRAHPILPCEGKSLLPILAGQQRPSPEALYFEHEGGRAIRQADWKLVARAGQPWELYDLATDRTETVDLAASHPDRVLSMQSLWKAWAARMNLN